MRSKANAGNNLRLGDARRGGKNMAVDFLCGLKGYHRSEADKQAASQRAIPLEGSCRDFDLSKLRIRDGLVRTVGRQGAEHHNADVFADHSGRSVAHANSGRPRMEAVRVVPSPLVRAIDNADSEGARCIVGTGKIGALNIVIGIVPTSPATARVADGVRRAWWIAANLVDQAILGLLTAPHPAPSLDPKIRTAGKLAGEDRRLRAVSDLVDRDPVSVLEARTAARRAGHDAPTARHMVARAAATAEGVAAGSCPPGRASGAMINLAEGVVIGRTHEPCGREARHVAPALRMLRERISGPRSRWTDKRRNHSRCRRGRGARAGADATRILGCECTGAECPGR